MQEALDTLRDTLKTHGASLTAPRRAVFTTLLDSKPLSIAEIAKKLEHTVDRSSIYRVVDLFEKIGIITRVQIGWKYKLELSDDFSAHHHHFSCTHCGTVYELEENTIIEFELKQLTQDRNFLMSGHQLEIRGVCARCRNLK